MQSFEELSPNQIEALSKPCRKCGVGPATDNGYGYKVGGVVKKNGRYGPWVQCDRCGQKVYRPRGRAFATGTQTTFVADTSVATQVTATVDPKDIEAAAKRVTENVTARVVSTVEEMGKKMLTGAVEDARKLLSSIQSELDKLRANTPTVIEVKKDDGKSSIVKNAHFYFARLVRLVKAGVPVYLWGPAGSGKTTAALQAAEALGIDAEIDTLDPTTFRSMIQGYMTPSGEPVHTAFTRCWTGGKGYVPDETDNAPGHVQTLFNSALANGHAPLAWGNVARKDGFLFIGTGNTPGRPTREFPDRKPMSAAFADRLYFIHWPLDPAIECRLAGLPIPARPEVASKKIDKQTWVTFVQRIREWSLTNAPTLMVTPRASIVGLTALSLGESPEQVADGLIFRGADKDLRDKALNACRNW